MKYIGWFSAVFILSFGLFLFTPQKSLAPGETLTGHAAFAGECLKCHTPFSRQFHDKCVECHEPEKIGLFNTRGKKITPAEKIAFDHKNDLPCALCHSEHKGPDIEAGMVVFSHAGLGSRLNECKSCHTGPGDTVHRNITSECRACHTTKTWKNASFDHSGAKECSSCHKAPAGKVHNNMTAECSGCHTTKTWKNASFDHSNAGECASCHKAPAGKVHDNMTAECSACHNTRKWSEATIDHDRFFRLGTRRHNPPCATCHPGNNYARYTCYGCHAHSERGVAREHLEEGIREYDNCVLCHRSGSEAEAKRNWRRLKQDGQAPSPVQYWGEGGDGSNDD